MAEPSEQAWGLMPLLLAAPGEGAAWRRFLGGLAAELSGEACVLLGSRPSRDAPGLLVTHGIELGDAGVLETKSSFRLPASLDHLTPGSLLSIAANDATLASDPLFLQALAPQGVRPGPGLWIVLERGSRHPTAALVVLSKQRGWRPATSDRALIERLAPHLVQAFRLHVRLAGRIRDTEALLAVFDRLVLGVLLLDEAGRVSYANRSAAEILDQPPGLAEPAALEKKGDPRTAALRRFIGTEHLTRGGALVFSHPQDDRPLQMFSTPLRWPAPAHEARERFARAIFIGDPSRTSGEPAEILQELYGLTQAEARLAILLATDHSLAEAARHLGVAVNTARTQLKTLFSKTGTNRQASLVRLLVSGPGQLRGPARRG